MLPPIKIPKGQTQRAIYNRYPKTNPPIWKENKKELPKVETAIADVKLEIKMLELIQAHDGLSSEELADLCGLDEAKVLRILGLYRRVRVVQEKDGLWRLT